MLGKNHFPGDLILDLCSKLKKYAVLCLDQKCDVKKAGKLNNASVVP